VKTWRFPFKRGYPQIKVKPFLVLKLTVLRIPQFKKPPSVSICLWPLGFSGRFFLGKRIEIISRYESVVSGWRSTTQSFFCGNPVVLLRFLVGESLFFAYFLGLGLKNLFFGWLNHMFVGIWHKICVHEGSSKKLNFTTISGISWDITGKSGHNHQCRGMPDVFWGDSWCIQNPNWDDQNSWARKNQICLIGS